MAKKSRSIKREIRFAIIISLLIWLVLIESVFVAQYLNEIRIAEKNAVENSYQQVEKMDDYIQSKIANATNLSYSAYLEKYYHSSHAERFATKDMTKKMLQEALLDKKTVGIWLRFNDETSLKIGEPSDMSQKEFSYSGSFKYHTNGYAVFTWTMPIYGVTGMLKELGEMQLTFDVNQLLKDYCSSMSMLQYEQAIVGKSDLINRESTTYVQKLQDLCMYNSNGRIRIDGQAHLYVRQRSNAMNCEILMLYSFRELVSVSPEFLRICLLLSLCCFGILTYVLISLQHRVTMPIEKLCRQVQLIAHGILQNAQVDKKEMREVSYLAMNINHMLEKIKNHTLQELKMQEKVMIAQARCMEEQFFRMQAQINPHFLYNNLECIRGMAWDGKQSEIAQMCTAMARIYAYGTRGSSLTATVEEELKCVREYETIIALRYGSLYRWSMSIAPECKSIRIPRMTLQPICENAVIHGRKPGNSEMQINIAAKMRGEWLVITVEDDGKGIQQEKIEKLNEELSVRETVPLEKIGDRVGLQNISRRLQLMGEDRARISLANREKGGTCVSIVVNSAATQEEHCDNCQ